MGETASLRWPSTSATQKRPFSWHLGGPCLDPSTLRRGKRTDHLSIPFRFFMVSPGFFKAKHTKNIPKKVTALTRTPGLHTGRWANWHCEDGAVFAASPSAALYGSSGHHGPANKWSSPYDLCCFGVFVGKNQSLRILSPYSQPPSSPWPNSLLSLLQIFAPLREVAVENHVAGGLGEERHRLSPLLQHHLRDSNAWND